MTKVSVGCDSERLCEWGTKIGLGCDSERLCELDKDKCWL